MFLVVPYVRKQYEVRIYQNRETGCKTRDGAAGVPEAAPLVPPQSTLSPKLH